MIEINELEKSFGKLNVLKNLCLSFEKGQVVSVVGPNGSGKTTLIKCILGMVIADKGSILVNGENIKQKYLYRNHIGYMPQIGRYPDNMKIGQVFEMMKDIRKGESLNLDEELLMQYQLGSLFEKSMKTLSGGTRQKVSAALAFLFNPDVLILDEPTAGLDPLASEILKDKIKKAKSQGKLIIITSHIMSEVDELADKILYMNDGRVYFYKAIEELKQLAGEDKLGKAIAKFIETNGAN